MLAHMFDAWPSQVYRWIVRDGLLLPDQEVSCEIREMEFDEMWHFIEAKK